MQDVDANGNEPTAIVDLPQQTEPPPPPPDLKTMAEQMTETEMKALVIQNFRMLTEIVGFVRMAATTLETLGTLGPAKSRLASSLLPAEAMEMARAQAEANASLVDAERFNRPNRAERRAAERKK